MEYTTEGPIDPEKQNESQQDEQSVTFASLKEQWGSVTLMQLESLERQVRELRDEQLRMADSNTKHGSGGLHNAVAKAQLLAAKRLTALLGGDGK